MHVLRRSVELAVGLRPSTSNWVIFHVKVSYRVNSRHSEVLILPEDAVLGVGLA